MDDIVNPPFLPDDSETAGSADSRSGGGRVEAWRQIDLAVRRAVLRAFSTFPDNRQG